jgi:hypothetical protein
MTSNMHLPYGEAIFSRKDGKLIIEQADPLILISDVIVDQLRNNEIRLDLGPETRLDGDSTLIIEASNRTIVYRIGEHLPHLHAYTADLQPGASQAMKGNPQ